MVYKSKGMPKISKLLVDSHNVLIIIVKNIKNGTNYNNYTYHFWMSIMLRPNLIRKTQINIYITPKLGLIHLLEVWYLDYSEKDGRKFKYTSTENENNNEFKKSKSFSSCTTMDSCCICSR